MARMQRSLFSQLNALAEEISQGAVKVAGTKKAEGPTPADPGTYTGASSHPSAHVDNDVQTAETGARASEYESDIKKQQGALAVDNTPEMSQEGRQDDVQLNIGTHASAVGEDPSVENDYKGDKDDPGTSHPAKTNDGEKYSSVSFKEAASRCSALGNDILASLLNASNGNTKAAEMPAFLKEKMEGKKHEKSESPAEEKAENAIEEIAKDEDKEAAFKAGYELAATLGLDKEAAEASVREVCANTLREADEMADLFVGFLSSKLAAADPAEQAAEGEDHSAPGDDESGANPAGGDAAPAEMMGGADPAAGGDMGDDHAGAMGGEGGPSDEDAIQELAMALEELGIPPEALLHAAHGGHEGAEGGEAAAAPEMAPKLAAANDLAAIGQEVIRFKRAGRFQVKEARTKRSRQLRDIMKQHVLELVNR